MRCRGVSSLSVCTAHESTEVDELCQRLLKPSRVTSKFYVSIPSYICEDYPTSNFKSEDVERLSSDARVANSLAPRTTGTQHCVEGDYGRSQKCWRHVCSRRDCGDNFGDDGRKSYIYLMVMCMQPDLVIKLNREVRRNAGSDSRPAYAAGDSTKTFGDIVRLAVFNIKGYRGNSLCPAHFSLRQQYLRANAMMEYWRGVFAESMRVREEEGIPKQAGGSVSRDFGRGAI